MSELCVLGIEKRPKTPPITVVAILESTAFCFFASPPSKFCDFFFSSLCDKTDRLIRFEHYIMCPEQLLLHKKVRMVALFRKPVYTITKEQSPASERRVDAELYLTLVSKKRFILTWS